MSEQIQLFFDKNLEAIKKRKDLKLMYKDALINNQEHAKITEELKTLREKKILLLN